MDVDELLDYALQDPEAEAFAARVATFLASAPDGPERRRVEELLEIARARKVEAERHAG